MTDAIFIGFAWKSWRLGVVRHKPGSKIVLALGPFRLALHDFSKR